MIECREDGMRSHCGRRSATHPSCYSLLSPPSSIHFGVVMVGEMVNKYLGM